MAGDRAAEDFVDEFKTLAVLQRLDAKIDFAELPGPAGLFLVTVMSLGVHLDRLAIGNLGRLCIDVQASVGELFQDQPQVEFAQAVDDDLVRLAIGVPFERGIFLGNFGQQRRNLLFITACPWCHREPVHGRGESQRLKMHAVQRVIVVQHVVGVDFFDLGDGADVAGDDLVGFLVILPLQVKDVAEFHGLFVVADEDLRVAAAPALVHAEQREFADKRIGRHLEDVRQ